ncbi:MAG: phosphatase [Atopobiaceae bacterium]
MNLACDVHTHTLFSRHAYSTIQENVEAAKAQGLELLGSTDHYSSMLFTEQDLRNFQFFINLSVWPRVWDGVCVLRGCEADIVDREGHLFGWDIDVPTGITDMPYQKKRSLKDMVFRGIDYAIASVHGKSFAEGATPAENAEMYVKALQDPKVAILGHIGRSGLKFELDPVLEEAARLHKMIEINEHSLDLSPSGKISKKCRKIAERAAELNVQIAVSTDAHIATDIGRLDAAAAMLEEIHFPEELIATRSKDAFLEALRAAGVADIQID